MNLNFLIIIATFLAVAAGVLFIIFSGYGIADLLKPSEKNRITSQSDPTGQGRQAAFKEEGPVWQHLTNLFIRPSKFSQMKPFFERRRT